MPKIYGQVKGRKYPADQPIVTGNTHKVCSRCRRELPLREFNQSKRTQDGYEANCKMCAAELQSSKGMRKDLVKCKVCGARKPESRFPENSKTCYLCQKSAKEGKR